MTNSQLSNQGGTCYEGADAARNQFKKIRARFAQVPDLPVLAGVLRSRQDGREVEILANDHSDAILEKIRLLKLEEVACKSMSLEEIFIASKTLNESA